MVLVTAYGSRGPHRLVGRLMVMAIEMMAMPVIMVMRVGRSCQPREMHVWHRRVVIARSIVFYVRMGKGRHLTGEVTQEGTKSNQMAHQSSHSSPTPSVLSAVCGANLLGRVRLPVCRHPHE